MATQKKGSTEVVKERERGYKGAVSDYIARLMDASGKTRREVASTLGYATGNIMTMIETGEMKLPINKIAALCKAIDGDPVYLFRLVMKEYTPETYKTLEEIMTTRMVSQKDANLLRLVNHELQDMDIDLAAEPAFVEALIPVLRKLRDQRKAAHAAVARTLGTSHRKAA
jgi:transcriptional regulator with XRE-family HTH domain